MKHCNVMLLPLKHMSRFFLFNTAVKTDLQSRMGGQGLCSEKKVMAEPTDGLTDVATCRVARSRPRTAIFDQKKSDHNLLILST